MVEGRPGFAAGSRVSQLCDPSQKDKAATPAIAAAPAITRSRFGRFGQSGLERTASSSSHGKRSEAAASWAWLMVSASLGRRDPHQRRPLRINLPYANRQFQPCARESCGLFSTRKRRSASVIAAIPQRVKFGCQIVKVKGDPVRFVRQCGAFRLCADMGGAPDQRQFLVIQQRQVTPPRPAIRPLRQPCASTS